MRQITNHRFDFGRNRIRDPRHELHDVTTCRLNITCCLNEHADTDGRWSLFTGGEVVREIFANFAGHQLNGTGMRLSHTEIARDCETTFRTDYTRSEERRVGKECRSRW